MLIYLNVNVILDNVTRKRTIKEEKEYFRDGKKIIKKYVSWKQVEATDGQRGQTLKGM